MQNLKIAVGSTDESLEIQHLLFNLGYVWESCGANIRSSFEISKYDFCTEHGFIRLTRNLKAETYSKLITLGVLREMVRLHKEENAMVLGDDLTTMQELEKIKEVGLISGADALRAIADGENVEVRALGANWIDAKNSNHPFGMFFDKDFEFRFKPHTVKFEIEIPPPFEPENGEHYWFICPYQESGYSWGHFYDGDHRIQFGAWRTEDEVKVVVKQMEKFKVIL